MDRLMCLKKPDLDGSNLSNVSSITVEYETAAEESSNSLYYSINEQTLEATSANQSFMNETAETNEDHTIECTKIGFSFGSDIDSVKKVNPLQTTILSVSRSPAMPLNRSEMGLNTSTPLIVLTNCNGENTAPESVLEIPITPISVVEKMPLRDSTNTSTSNSDLKAAKKDSFGNKMNRFSDKINEPIVVDVQEPNEAEPPQTTVEPVKENFPQNLASIPEIVDVNQPEAPELSQTTVKENAHQNLASIPEIVDVHQPEPSELPQTTVKNTIESARKNSNQNLASIPEIIVHQPEASELPQTTVDNRIELVKENLNRNLIPIIEISGSEECFKENSISDASSKSKNDDSVIEVNSSENASDTNEAKTEMEGFETKTLASKLFGPIPARKSLGGRKRKSLGGGKSPMRHTMVPDMRTKPRIPVTMNKRTSISATFRQGNRAQKPVEPNVTTRTTRRSIAVNNFRPIDDQKNGVTRRLTRMSISSSNPGTSAAAKTQTNNHPIAKVSKPSKLENISESNNQTDFLKFSNNRRSAMPTYDDDKPSTSGLNNAAVSRKSIAVRQQSSNSGLRDAHVTKARRSILPVSSKVQQSIKKQTTRPGASANLSSLNNLPRRQSIRINKRKSIGSAASPSKTRRTSFKIYSPSTARPRKSIGRKELTVKSLIPLAKGAKSNDGHFLKPKPSLTCDVCRKTFRLQTNLIQHRKNHNDNSTNACKFCDKKFALKGALLTHQQDNCTKIPFDERKKLLSPKRKPTQRNTKNNESIDTTADSLFSSDSSCSLSSSIATAVVSSARSASTKKMAHSGIYRTPSKPITCGTCKITFPDLFSFTTHAEEHSNESMNLAQNSLEGKKLF